MRSSSTDLQEIFTRQRILTSKSNNDKRAHCVWALILIITEGMTEGITDDMSEMQKKTG